MGASKLDQNETGRCARAEEKGIPAQLEDAVLGPQFCGRGSVALRFCDGANYRTG